MMTFLVVLSTKMHNTNMISSKLIIQNNAQKEMARYGFGSLVRGLIFHFP